MEQLKAQRSPAVESMTRGYSARLSEAQNKNPGAVLTWLVRQREHAERLGRTDGRVHSAEATTENT